MKGRNKQTDTGNLGHNTAHLSVPHWLIFFYTFAGITLLPWTIYISANLPVRHVSRNWDVSWGGFDAFVVFLLLLSAYFIARKSLWVVASASALSAALLFDGWFDILTSRQGIAFDRATITGITIELPVALLSFYVAAHVTRQAIHQVQITPNLSTRERTKHSIT